MYIFVWPGERGDLRPRGPQRRRPPHVPRSPSTCATATPARTVLRRAACTPKFFSRLASRRRQPASETRGSVPSKPPRRWATPPFQLPRQPAKVRATAPARTLFAPPDESIPGAARRKPTRKQFVACLSPAQLASYSVCISPTPPSHPVLFPLRNSIPLPRVAHSFPITIPNHLPVCTRILCRSQINAYSRGYRREARGLLTVPPGAAEHTGLRQQESCKGQDGQAHDR